MDNKEQVWKWVEAHQQAFSDLSDRVWGVPEICYTEYRSVAEHTAMLKEQGFRVTENVAGIPTAVMGEAGEGGPIIAFLGEYDALPGLSQASGVAHYSPLPGNGNGHGCGHNLLGSGAMLAATALKAWLEESGTPGRVRYYGCPAEEGGAAKSFMARAGAFDGV
ncbi:MAG TPA: M20/M25/M40 family metallo-hydrolase, partial [Enterobacteriaceae bacterium]|nr:M20/M25/M40 family metallo-hydrolase [Enterobacteriaceae bacterium]